MYRGTLQFSDRRSGSTFSVVLLGVVVFCIAIASFWLERQYTRGRICQEHLHEIYTALELYEMEYGILPSLAFYPDKPREDDDSLRVFLEGQGLDGDCCVCPATPPLVREAGLSYVWNVAMNGQKMHGWRNPQWILVEVNALSDQVPAPHRGRYHILYTDGRVVATRDLPHGMLDR